MMILDDSSDSKIILEKYFVLWILKLGALKCIRLLWIYQ